jgi:hypothetical protein
MAASPILALTLMAAAMIAAAISGQIRTGLLLATLGAAIVIVLARASGMPPPVQPLWLGVTIIIAGVSFAVRGALFARSAGSKGWVIAAFVVAGEAAVLLTAAARPGLLPEWLLALLPAQWANLAFATATHESGAGGAAAALIALAATAAATQLVACLWPRRWPYAVMFTIWLTMAALVWHWPAPA